MTEQIRRHDVTQKLRVLFLTHYVKKKVLIIKHSNPFEATTLYTVSKGKGKAIPLPAWTGPESSRRLSIPDFKTTGT